MCTAFGGDHQPLSDILILKNIDLDNLGQDHGVQHSNDIIRWQMSMSIEVRIRIVAPALNVSAIVIFRMFDHENLSQGTEYNISADAVR